MAKPKEKIIRKKVSPYPLEVLLTIDGKPLRGSILKLTTRGFFVDLHGQMLKINTQTAVSFQIPVLKIDVQANAKLIKFLDRVKAQAPERLAEMHFLGLSEEHKKNIARFCVAIRQEEV